MFGRKDKKREQMIDSLLHVEGNETLFAKLTTLQNEISVAFDTKVLVVASLGDDELAAVFAKGLADAYGLNGSKALVIDANLFEPSLAKMLGQEAEGENTVKQLSDMVSAIFMKKETYPSTVYKNKIVQQLVTEHEGEYDHFIILVPSLIDHKEVVLLNDILNSVLLVSRRDVTKKRDIFNALQFCAQEKIPVSKTIILK